MISVIAPCLNEEEHLPYFLESLAQQIAEFGFELIVIDGGSRDRSREIVDSYDQRLIIIKLLNETRNLGFIRNLGAKVARGEILLFTNTDAVLPELFMHDLRARFFISNLDSKPISAISGRTVPWDGGVLCSFAYGAFDLLRWGFSKIGRFSPSGNFLACKRECFWEAGGFPEVKLNEDGILGSRIQGRKEFCLDMWAGHFADRWRGNGMKTLGFYSYVFGNFSPKLKRALSRIERKSSGEFDRK